MNNLNNNQNSNKSVPEKNLSQVFAELQEVRKKQALENMTTVNIEQNYKSHSHSKKVRSKGRRARAQNAKSRIARIDYFENPFEQKNINTYSEDHIFNNNYGKHAATPKFNAVGAIIGILFVIMFASTINSNYIFATSTEEEKEQIGTFEENENPINLMNYVSENISEVVKKEIVTETYTIDREYVYINNNQLPKDEEKIIEEGNDGTKEVTYIRSYANDEFVDEQILNENILVEASKATVEVGTSEFLANVQAHIGDTLYTLNEVNMMTEADESGIQICKIYQYIDVELEEIANENWVKVKVDGLEGYVLCENLTSATINPEIVEESRIQRIMLSVNFNMQLNQPSGLTRADFVKIFSNNSEDVNSIFENNAGLFYDIEQKYNINGIFLASIGIHESAWGTSAIATAKKNLFGYGAYDSSPSYSAYTFESYEYGIELVAKVLVKYYLNEEGTEIYDGETASGSFYNGATVSGVNVRYASDTEWASKVYAIMETLYEKLQ